MEATCTEQGTRGVDVLVVDGSFDPAVGLRVARRILALADEGRRAFVVDLSAATVDPRAMIPLVRVARQLERSGVRISVVFDSLLAVFTAPGLEALYDVAVTREDAIDRVLRQPARPAAPTARTAHVPVEQ